MSGYVDPYRNPAHVEWVTNGGCPAIHLSKAWCNQRSMHHGDHRAPSLNPAGEVAAYLWWNDADNHPRVS